MRTMKAAVYDGPNSIAMEETPVPEGREGWALIKVAYCGICGTDMNIFSGNHPRAKKPLIIGHEFSGTIVEHSVLSSGTPVTVRPLLFCDDCEPCQNGVPHVCQSLRLIGIDTPGGMAEYVLVPEEEVYVLPEKMSLRRGALIEPFAVAVHAVRQSDFKPGDQATVFGAGPIGLSTAITLKQFGALSVSVVEVNSFRRQVAESLGFTVFEGMKHGMAENDIVFDCAAHPLVAQQIVNATKIRGQIVLVGTYKFPAEIDLQNITFKEISIKGTRVYTKKDYEIATHLLSSDFEYEKLISQIYELEDVKTAFEELTTGGDNVKIMISL